MHDRHASLEMMEIEFYGAAGRVTGSCHVVRIGNATVLLDCGMIQGSAHDEALNARPFPFDANAVDAVVLSHAHLDHAGRLPLLVQRGFEGVIHAQKATRALMEILLKDAVEIEASVTRRENRRRAERHERLLQPLFDRNDVDRALSLTESHRYGAWFDVAQGVSARFHDAGHIMGSAVVELAVHASGVRRTLVFSGDLGQYDSPILMDPAAPERADVVLMESTYGDRTHRDRDASMAEFGKVLRAAHEQRGNVLIPAFAVGRSQEILYQLGKHFSEWGLENWHIFLDSPLAIEASDIYWNFQHLFDDEAARMLRGGDIMPGLPNLHYTRTANESKVINRLSHGALIIAGSGMCNGGRILHHLRRDVGKPQTHLIFTGFQPPGTLGRRIIDGAESIRIHGESHSVRAQVHTIGGLSAHGDRDDLLRWYGGFAGTPPVYLVHGDPEASATLQETLRSNGVAADLPTVGHRVDLAALNPPG